MAGYTLVLDIGEYSLVSGAIALISSRFYTAGAYTLIGADVALNYVSSSGTAYTLVLAEGTYVLTGTDAVFERSIAGNAGIYAITGTTVTLIWNQSLGTL